jgi:predicted nucleic acid-binding protein
VTVTVDASVAIKWVVSEPGSNAAERLVQEEALAAPDFMIVECANVLRTKARRGDISPADARSALAGIRATPVQLFASSDYTTYAQELALELDQTVYDCLYLAVALTERMVLVTGDEAFTRAVRQHGPYRSAVRLLME